MHKRLVSILAIAVAAIALLAGSASGELVKAGNLVLTVGGNERPTKLPRSQLSPITLNIFSDISTQDGSVPPALQKLVLMFDKHGTVDTKGLPTCTAGKLENTTTATARKICKDALVGTGHTTALVAFPDQAAFIAKGPLLAFNGVPRGGHPVVIMHVYAFVPAPTTFVVPGDITNAHGKYGKQVSINVPPIAGGYGSLTHFDISVHRTWTYKGKKHSYVIARCANGNFLAHGDYTFADGSEVSGSVVRTCTPKG